MIINTILPPSDVFFLFFSLSVLNFGEILTNCTIHLTMSPEFSQEKCKNVLGERVCLDEQGEFQEKKGSVPEINYSTSQRKLSIY